MWWINFNRNNCLMKLTWISADLHTYHKSIKVEAVVTLNSAHDVQEVRSEDERHALPLHTPEQLSVSQNVTKVDVKQIPCERNHESFSWNTLNVFSHLISSVKSMRRTDWCYTLVCDHDVVVVSISNTQNIHGYTVPSTGLHKALHCLIVLQK